MDSFATKSSRKKRYFQSDSATPRNHELSVLFTKLSKLHQSCPLLAVDNWKAYCFSVISSRLRHLDFEITDNPDTLERVRKVKGIGESSLDKIKEYLQTGTISRIQEFESDPKRVAMKKMMNIWGVGRNKVGSLFLF